MPRRVTRAPRASDRWAGLRLLNPGILKMLVGEMPAVPEPPAGLDPLERERWIAADEAKHREGIRYLAWQLGVLAEAEGGPATEAEVERWEKRARKAARRARKAAKRRSREVTEPDPPDPVIEHRGPWTDPDEEGADSRVPVIPPPSTPQPRRERGYYDEDDD